MLKKRSTAEAVIAADAKDVVLLVGPLVCPKDITDGKSISTWIPGPSL
jgi:hypothetical protein